MPMKKEQQKKDGMTTGALGGNTPSVLLFLIITLFLLLNHTTHAIKCLSTGDLGTNIAKPLDDILHPRQISTTAKSYSYCFVAYNLDGGKVGDPNWKLKSYTYVAGGDQDFHISVCNEITEHGNGTCKEVNTTGTIDKSYWRLDFACCCDTPYPTSPDECNDVSQNAAMNPQIQLNATDQQICRVGYPPDKRIDSCTRHTSLTETQSPSKCRSVLKGGQSELGCAHDGVSDRCNWTSTYPQKSGVCRGDPGGDIECCCEGAYCNGLNYMKLACRSEITASKTSNKFIYGDGKCKAEWPNTPTTTIDTTDGPANKGDNSGNKNGAPNTETSTGTTGSDHFQPAWIGLIVVGVVIVVLLVVLSGCGVCMYKLYQHVRYPPACERKHKQEPDGDELSGVTIGVDTQTDSEREEDNYQPRILINPAEKADELRRLGNQAAGTSVTINPNEGSDFGDHTEARGGVFDDDSEAASTTTGKATTNQTNTNMTTSTKATNKTEPPSTNKSTQKKKKSAKEKDKGKEKKKENEQTPNTNP